MKTTIQELHDSIEDKESKVAEYTEKIVELTEDVNSQKVLFIIIDLYNSLLRRFWKSKKC